MDTGYVKVEVIREGAVMLRKVIDVDDIDKERAKAQARWDGDVRVRVIERGVAEPIRRIAEQACGWHPSPMSRYGR